MIKIGITGGIGSGKTTVCEIFEVLGVPVYYADIRAKKLMTGNKVVKQKIKDLLGVNAYFKNGRLNRGYISSKVFNDKQLLNALNSIVHPAVGLDFDNWCTNQTNSHYVLKEAALLIESKSYLTLDKLVLVIANQDVRLNRVIVRDGSNAAEVQKRIDNQLPEDQKLKYADYTIDNSGNVSVIHQVIELHKELNKL